MSNRKTYTPSKRAVPENADIGQLVRHTRDRDRDHIAIAEVFASYDASLTNLEAVSIASFHRVQIQAGRVTVKPAGAIARFAVDSGGRLALGFNEDAERGFFSQCLSTTQRHSYYATVLANRSLTIEARDELDNLINLAMGSHLFNLQIIQYP